MKEIILKLIDVAGKQMKYILVAGCIFLMANKDDVEKVRMSVDINVFDTAHISSLTYSDPKRFRLYNPSDSVQWFKCVLSGKNDADLKDTVNFPLSPMSWSPGIFVRVLPDVGNSDTVIYWGK